MTRLPIDDCLPQVVDAVSRNRSVVIEAPPGAGKTTRVPLALLRHVEGRIMLLEPRRIAARTAAARMAASLGEAVGDTVGYRIGGDSRVCATTRIEVVTEGILTRMLQSSPDLPGTGAVIFDEFHERSLNGDLGLALCLEVRAALRPDLRLLAMSATLDAGPLAAMMQADRIVSGGRAFPVETTWLDRPAPPGIDTGAQAAAAVLAALAEDDGGILAFLPGEGEIRAVERRLSEGLPSGCVIRPLFGAMPREAQDAAIRPDPIRRKIVLATAIAETSLTIEDIRVVVDAGLARRSRFTPGSGMSRLVTERASRAEADQRRGRAGRVGPGRCRRLWTQAEEGAMPEFAPPEVLTADLAGFALDLAQWGAPDGSGLSFLTPPPAGPIAAARRLLVMLEAVDPAGRITDHGRRMAALPLHPRLSHMAVHAGAAAAPLAALLSARRAHGMGGVDLAPVLRRFREAPPEVREEARKLARRVPKAGQTPDLSASQMAALAYPDRIAVRRSGSEPRWLLAGGQGVRMDASDSLASAPYLVVTQTDGRPRDARIRSAIAIGEEELREIAAERIAWHRSCRWSSRAGRVEAVEEECLDAIVLTTRPWRDPPDDAQAAALLEGLRDTGLPWSPAARNIARRSDLLRAAGHDLPALDDESLFAQPERWLLPHLAGRRTVADLSSLDLEAALLAGLDWRQREILDRLAPSHYRTPTGRRVAIDYLSETPTVAVRLQEMFGQTVHPSVAARPLRLSLLSPAGRPVQVTSDLPAFWASSYADVRRDMRGRYPRHPWPDDPQSAAPTLRAKPRGRSGQS